jgi:hypothetical protein
MTGSGDRTRKETARYLCNFSLLTFVTWKGSDLSKG